MIRGFPNGATHPDDKSGYSDVTSESVPAELKHLSKRRKRKKILPFNLVQGNPERSRRIISPVAASEKEGAQTDLVLRTVLIVLNVEIVLIV